MIEPAWIAGLVATLTFAYFTAKIVVDFRARRWAGTAAGVLIGFAATYFLIILTVGHHDPLAHWLLCVEKVPGLNEGLSNT